MAQPAGTQYIVFRQRIFVAQLGSKLPSMGIPKGGDWNTGLAANTWVRVPHTDEGCTITPSAPKDDITSDEAGGAIGVVPAGDSEITIGFTPLTPDLSLFSWLSSMQQRADVAQANEIITFDFTGSSNVATAGNLTIGLNGVNTLVAVALSDTASGVAGKVAAATYTDWTPAVSGTVVTFTRTTAGATTTAPTFGAGGTGVTMAAGSPAVTRPYATSYKRFSLTPEGKQFMFGVEGEFAEGSLTTGGGFVRAFGYKVEQTNEVDISMRRTGDDAVVRLEAELRCLSTTVDPVTQLAATGIAEVDDRFDFFIMPA